MIGSLTGYSNIGVLATTAGAKGDGTTDDILALQAVLDAGNNLILDARTFAISVSLKPKFQGQKIWGLNERTSVLKQTTSTEHGIEVTGNYATSDPKYGSGAYANTIANLTVQLPGTYNAGDGTFSGSTGNGIHFARAVSSHLGDFLTLENIHVHGANRAVNVDGYGNCTWRNISCEYGNHGMCISVTSAGATGATGNGYDINGFTSSNNAGTSIWWLAGQGNRVSLRDLNSDDLTAGTPIVVTAQVDFHGGNFEGMGTSEKIIDISSAASIGLWGLYFRKGGSANDGSPVRVSADCQVSHAGCSNGYTAEMIAGTAPSGGGRICGFNEFMTIGGRAIANSPLQTVNDNGIPTADATNVGTFYRVIDRSGGIADYLIMSIRNADGSTFSMTPCSASGILITANTWTASQTWAANQRVILPVGGAAGGPGSASGGLQIKGSSVDWLLRSAQVEGNDIALFSGTNRRLLITEAGVLSIVALTVESGGALKLGNAATTGLTPGVLAAQTDASIVLTDSAGQAYRIPCIV